MEIARKLPANSILQMSNKCIRKPKKSANFVFGKKKFYIASVLENLFLSQEKAYRY